KCVQAPWRQPAAPRRGVSADHQALPKPAFLPFWLLWRWARHTRIWKSLTRCCALVPRQTQHLGLIRRRQFSPHRVVPAVNVQELAGGHVEEVGEEDGDRPTDRRSVLQTQAVRSPVLPSLF